jgi:hypothetical protein
MAGMLLGWRTSIIVISIFCRHNVIVFNETSLRCHLQAFRSYYDRGRTHLGLQKDTPEPRPVQLPEAGHIISIAEVCGLHHRYERRAA